MTVNEFRVLRAGDIVRHRSPGSPALLVTACYGDRVTAVRTYDLTNPPEWEVVSRAGHNDPTRFAGDFDNSKHPDRQPTVRD